MKKLLFYCSIVLLFYCFINLAFPSSIQAQLPSFTWIVTDQNGNPLNGAVVWINLNGTYIATCTTGASGQCSETISCAPPCQLDGQVEWQGQTGNYGGSFPDGATIPVTINIPSPSPPPPGPSPTPDPYPSPTPFIPPTYTPYDPAGELHCDPEADSKRDSRPYYEQDCDLCNLTGMFCPSCATSFTVSTTVEWQWQDKNCDIDGPWQIEEWGGNVIIDPTQTKIPFVGKKRVEGNINAREDEQKYLADYFDGTHEYYRTYDVRAEVNIPLIDKQIGFTAFHGTNTTLLPNFQGVFRKLTPMEYQDELKKEMVQRAKETQDIREEGVHDYNVAYKPRLCWDLSFFGEAVIDFANSIAGSKVMELGIGEINASNLSNFFSFLASLSHYCLYNFSGATDDAKLNTAKTAIDVFNDLISSLGPLGDLFKIQTEGKINGVEKTLTEIDGHFPPEPDEEDYTRKWQEWKNSEWGRVWEAVPMVSREDTPGWISPYYNYRRLDEPKYIEPRVEKVPHVARLYESTQEIQNILFPFTEEEVTSQKEGEPICSATQPPQPIIASPGEGNVLGEKTLLAQACLECPILSIANPSYSNGAINWTYSLCHSCPDHGCIGDVFVGPCGNVQVKENVCPPCFSTSHPAIAPPVPISCPGTAFICAAFKCDNCEGCPGSWQSTTCSVEVDADCNIINTTCGVVGPPAPPTCEIPPEGAIPQCVMDSITDTNPNDDLCCDKISLGMSFKDAFEDTGVEYWYTPCEYDIACCDNPLATSPCLCNPECETWEYRTVTRDWGISLSHPYLTEIWNQTAYYETNGLFNIFRPFEIPEFEELDAYSTINYGFTGGDIDPSEGKFYFNYLGGVQKAKEWVTTKVLMPYIEQ